jgi:mono/diheme cytochrome c family protein
LDYLRWKLLRWILSIIAMSVLVAGCGTAASVSTTVASTPVASVTRSASSPEDEAQQRGEQLFSGFGGCSACHTVDGSGGLPGPDLAGVADRAVKIHPDVSVEEALEVEIVDPNAYIPEGYWAGLMPSNYADTLTPQQLQDLIAYMKSLK